jgi:hypothetical protein
MEATPFIPIVVINYTLLKTVLLEFRQKNTENQGKGTGSSVKAEAKKISENKGFFLLLAVFIPLMPFKEVLSEKKNPERKPENRYKFQRKRLAV